MPLQVANPTVVGKVERLTAILTQLDQLPDLADGTAGAVDLDWDDLGLPR